MSDAEENEGGRSRGTEALSTPLRGRGGQDAPAVASTGSAPLAPEPGDWYMEGQYVVFTEQYHLRRGYCCNSGCRHCPYR